MGLIRFFSPAGAQVFMLEGHVRPVMKEAGIRFGQDGAILPEDIPGAIEKLNRALERLGKKEEDSEKKDAKDSAPAAFPKEEPVPLKTRFFPLLSLMGEAAKKGKILHWETLKGAPC